jgi:hypothetical protein
VRVTSATYVLEDLAESETSAARTIASGPATVDALDVAVAADSGRGTTAPRTVFTVAGAAQRGHVYVLEGDDDSELVRLESVAATYVTAAAPLSARYPATSSRLRGVELTATFPSAAAAREDLQEEDRVLRIVWTYTIAGRVVRVAEQVRLRRDAADVRYLGRAEAVIREDWPELVQALPKHGNAVRTVVSACARSLTAKLKGRSIPPETFLAGDIGFELLLARCLLRIAERGHAPAGTDLERWREERRIEFFGQWKALTTGTPGLDVADVDPVANEAPLGSSRRRRNLIARM